MKKLSIFLFLFMSVTFLFAQQEITVSGKVTDDTDLGLPGVTIVEKGTQNGTVTDVQGNYSVTLPPQSTLAFSFVGFQTQEIPVNGQNTINLKMSESTVDLDEVVVVGYGQQKVKDLTSSIVTIDSEELVQTPAGQTMQALQGKVAGVQVVNAGAPGGEPTVRIRGISSFPGSSNSSPLYVVDGMYFDNIDFLNPNDIQNVSVLKDASASAIYGVRAANGVVLITTKSGSLNEKSTVTYEGYYGIQVPQNVIQMSNAEQFVNYIYQTGDEAHIAFIQNAMQRYGRSRINPGVPAVNTDWYAEIMRSYASQQNHSLSIRGGNDKTTYSMGMSYYDQEGLLETDNSYQRMNMRTKLDHQVNDWLKAGVNMNVSNGKREIASDAAWFSAYHAVPILPVYDEQNYEGLLGSDIQYPSRYTSADLIGYKGTQNPFISMDYNNNRQDIRKILSGIFAEVDLLPQKLTFKTNYNLSYMFIKGRNVGLPYFISSDTNRPVSTIASSRTTEVNQFWDNTLTYMDSFGAHNFTAMVGTSYRDEWWDYLSGSASDIPLDENSWYIGQSRVAESKTANDNAERLYGISYFGRLSYNYDERYIAYFTLRREGTSKYQETWGTFPAVGLGWIVSEENFLQGSDVFDFLKLRVGWGKLGNDKIPRQDGANTTNPVYLAIDDTQVDGTKTTSTFGYLSWETVKETNLGITAAFVLRVRSGRCLPG